MNAIPVTTILTVLAAGPAFGADKPPCDLLTREQVASVVGAGAIATDYAREELPQRKAKELTPIHVCGWFVKETQSAVEVRVVAAPADAEAARKALGSHGKRRHELEFGNVSCWAEDTSKAQFPSTACVGSVKRDALKVLFRSNTATPTIQQAKSLFDEAVAGL